MDQRFMQAHKEARYAFGLTLGYCFCWWAVFYFSSDDKYGIYWMNHPGSITGLPLWFEVACIFLPLVFVVLCIFMIKLVFRDIPLDNPKDKNNAP